MRLIPAFIYRRIAHRPNLAKAFDNVSWLFFDKIVRMGLGLLVGVWVARYLGPEQFGLLSFAQAFVGLFGPVAALGLPNVVVRNIVRNPQVAGETLGTAALLHLVGGAAAYLLILGTIACTRPDDLLMLTIVAILGSMMLLKTSDIALYWFESQVQSKYVVWVQTSTFCLFAAIKVGLIINHEPIVMFAWVALAETMVIAVTLLLIMDRRGQPLINLSLHIVRARGLLKDSWPLIMSTVAITIYMRVDQIMLGQMIGDQAVGIYSAAIRIGEVWYFIPLVIVASVSPAIISVKQRDESEYYARLQKLYDLMVVLSLAVAIPITFLANSIVDLLFGKAYVGAGPVLAIHAWATVFVFLAVASEQWFLAENRLLLSLKRTAIGAVANIGLNIWLIPIYGPLGAAIATVASQAVMALFTDLLQPETRLMFTMKTRAMSPWRARHMGDLNERSKFH